VISKLSSVERTLILHYNPTISHGNSISIGGVAADQGYPKCGCLID
jgi:hypothetical protein